MRCEGLSVPRDRLPDRPQRVRRLAEKQTARAYGAIDICRPQRLEVREMPGQGHFSYLDIAEACRPEHTLRLLGCTEAEEGWAGWQRHTRVAVVTNRVEEE